LQVIFVAIKNEKNNSKYNGSVRGMNEMGEYIILYTSSTFAAGRIICERRVTCIIGCKYNQISL